MTIKLKYRDQAIWPAYETTDALRIQEIFEKRGYHITLEDAHRAWEDYSASMAAGWLFLPENDEDVFDTVYFSFEVAECKSDLE